MISDLGFRHATIVGIKHFAGASEVIIGRIYPVKHEPDNPKDRNAVVVTTATKTIGYLRKDVALLLAGFLGDSRLRVGAEVLRKSKFGAVIECVLHFRVHPTCGATYESEIKSVMDSIRRVPV